VTRVGGKWPVQNHSCPRASSQGNHVEKKYPTYPTFLVAFISVSCLSCARSDVLPKPELASRPSSKHWVDQPACNKRCRHSSKLVRLDLATFIFSECQISPFGGQRVATESATEYEPTGLVCLCLRSIVNIPLQVGFGILNA